MLKANKMRTKVVRFGILAAALLFIGIGIAGEEHLDVMQKAVRICLECIGIG